jgi:alpha-galactosidase
MIRIKYQVLLCGAAALIAANGFALWAQGSNAEVYGKSNTQDISIMSAQVHVRYHRRAGTMDIAWSDGHSLLGIVSSATLADGRKLSTDQYPNHDLQASEVDSPRGHGREYIIRSSGNGLPALSQHIMLYDDRPWLTIQAELDSEGSHIGTRHFDPLIIRRDDPVRIGPAAALRVLHVPFDNDMWFRFASIPVSTMKDDEVFSGEEVTAIYDNAGRQGLVIGSITHDTWKTAIDFQAIDGQLQALDAYGGISAPNGVRSDTHDVVAHGIVHGDRVLSPRIFIGSFSDWRDGLEAYGKANAEVQPPLHWPEGVPEGWNSWAAYGGKIDYARYLAAARFVEQTLAPEGFGRGKTIYINLDAFWSRLDAAQLADAVAIIRAMKGSDGTPFQPGIYWTPFAYWSDNLDAFVEGTGMHYRYRDILLKAPDGSFLPKVDGGRTIDPSHPGAKLRTAFYRILGR